MMGPAVSEGLGRWVIPRVVGSGRPRGYQVGGGLSQRSCLTQPHSTPKHGLTVPRPEKGHPRVVPTARVGKGCP